MPLGVRIENLSRRKDVVATVLISDTQSFQCDSDLLRSKCKILVIPLYKPFPSRHILQKLHASSCVRSIIRVWRIAGRHDRKPSSFDRLSRGSQHHRRIEASQSTDILLPLCDERCGSPWKNLIDNCILRSAKHCIKFTQQIGTFFTDSGGSLRDRRMFKVGVTSAA